MAAIIGSAVHKEKEREVLGFVPIQSALGSGVKSFDHFPFFWVQTIRQCSSDTLGAGKDARPVELFPFLAKWLDSAVDALDPSPLLPDEMGLHVEHTANDLSCE